MKPGRSTLVAAAVFALLDMRHDWASDEDAQ